MNQPVRSKTALGDLTYEGNGNLLELHGTTVPADGKAGYATGCLFYKTNGGAGTSLYVNEGSATSSLFKPLGTNGVVGTAAGFKIARGETALDGSNPTTVATGLATVVAFVACLKGTAAPGDNTSVLTVDIQGTNVDVYAWKNTGGTDPTLVASTGTETFYWIAIGT